MADSIRHILVTEKNFSDYAKQLDDFEKTVYLPAFPNVDEREPFENILARIIPDDNNKPQALIVLQMINNEVTGGAIFNWYRNSGSLHLIYFAMREDKRYQGLGELLLNNSKNFLRGFTLDEGRVVDYFFVEVEDPSRTTYDSPLKPAERLCIWQRWGATKVPINYIMPPLTASTSSLDNLMLMTVPLNDQREPSASGVMFFLIELYWGLGQCKNKALNIMLNEILDKQHHGKIQSTF